MAGAACGTALRQRRSGRAYAGPVSTFVLRDGPSALLRMSGLDSGELSHHQAGFGGGFDLGQAEVERRIARPRGEADLAAVLFDQQLADRQAQAGAVGRARRIGLGELVEHFGAELGRNAGPMVGDRHHEAGALARR